MDETPVATNAANLALRGLLEFAALISIVFAAADMIGGVTGVVLGLAAAGAFVTVWGVFAVPNDPSRSGRAPLPVAGWIRLFLEIVLLGIGAWAAWIWLGPVVGVAMAALTIAHYAAWPSRTRWLLAR